MYPVRIGLMVALVAVTSTSFLAQTAQGLLKVLELLLVKHEVCAHWLTFPDGAKIHHRGAGRQSSDFTSVVSGESGRQWNSRQPRRMSASAMTSSEPAV